MDVDPTEFNKIRVLLVDDDEDDYFLIKSIFRRIRGQLFELDWCSDFYEARELIAENNYDAYLIDYFLGEFSGLELIMDAQAETRVEPFILLTGAADRELEQRSLEVSASDYLVKGSFGPELLSRTIQYAIGRKQAEKQRVEHLIELNRAKDEFISIASHQLRTPATGVKQYLGMLLEGFLGDVDEKQKSIIAKAYQSNERQLRIVSDLLKVAQVDSGKVNLRMIDVNLNELIKDVIHEQQDTYDKRDQKISFKSSDLLASVSIDPDSVRMVIENFVDNASKYSMPNTEVTVSIGEQDDLFYISVKDQGVGIAKKDQAQLFEKFFRIENALSTKVGGTGLGLYWAKKIIDLHGGMITYDSVENEGTDFKIFLPKNRN